MTQTATAAALFAAPADQWTRTAPKVFTDPNGWTVVNAQDNGYPWIIRQPDGTAPTPNYAYRLPELAMHAASKHVAPYSG